MKKIFLTIIFFLAAVSIYARDYSHPVGYYRLQSNHSSIKRRTNMGKDTYNNSSDFISIRLRANTYDGGPEVSITPSYGFRRAIGKHWVQEFTLGFRLGVNSDSGFFAPHAQYRIGFVF